MRRLAPTPALTLALAVPALAFAAPAGKNGSFRKRHVPDPSSDFHVILKGSFKGSRASGSVTGEGVCGYEERWTARR